ncbi:MAG: 4Fe-4S binding protein [Duncaniella sp.]|nr:4Fe-4S binding protein [Duncaniella sp.]
MTKNNPHPSFSSRKCVACWKCVDACPRHAIRKVSFLWHRHVVVTRGLCIGCNLCVKACPQGCFRKNDKKL